MCIILLNSKLGTDKEYQVQIKKVEILESPNNWLRHYSLTTNVKLIDTAIEHFDFPFKTAYLDMLEEFGPAVASFYKRVSNIRGVEDVFIKPYEVSVHMAGLNVVTDEVKKILEDFIYLSAYYEEIVVKDITMRVSFDQNESAPIVLDFSRQISNKSIKLDKHFRQNRLKGMNNNLINLICDFFAVEGIISVDISDYKIDVYVAPLFDKIAVSAETVELCTKFLAM